MLVTKSSREKDFLSLSDLGGKIWENPRRVWRGGISPLRDPFIPPSRSPQIDLNFLLKGAAQRLPLQGLVILFPRYIQYSGYNSDHFGHRCLTPRRLAALLQ
jgi:hypothetical protein